MDAALSKWGVGALLAWVALPLFAWLVRPRARPDAVTLHRAQLAALLAALALLVGPWLPLALPAWVLPSAPYYSIELRAVVAAVPNGLWFSPREPPTGLSPTSLIGALWLTAVALAATRTVLGVRTVSAIVARAAPAAGELFEVVALRARAKQIVVPRLLISDQTAIPFATGLVRSTIVLPRELVESLERPALELVLEHELEHVRRGDVRTAAFVTLLKVALGAHPTAEKIAREAVLAREIAVDAQVSRECAHAYATLLVEIAAHAHFGEKPAATAIDDTALARRIALLAEPLGARPLSLLPMAFGAIAMAMLASLAGTLVSWQPAPPRFFAAGAPWSGSAAAGVPGPGTAGLAMGQHGPGMGVRAFGRGPQSLRGAAPPPSPELPLVLMQSPELRECYARAADKEPALAVHATLALSADRSGAVSVSVMVPEAPSLASCLQSALKQIAPRLELPAGANFHIGLELAPDTMQF
jgi:beta-lactamase regulating signal transducer with metallopeptidase domain